MNPAFSRAAVLSAPYLLCASLFWASGCAAAQPETDAGTAAEPAATAPATDEEEAVLAAYTGMWDAVVAASHGDEDASRTLDDHAVDGARELMRTALADAAAGGTADGAPVLDPAVSVESPELAVVEDCVDDSDWRVGGAGGTAGPRQVDATLIHDGLAWRVSELRIWEAGSC